MNNQNEKPSILRIAINAFFTAIIGFLISSLVQWFTLENVLVTVSPSSNLNGKYLTVLSIRNLQDKTLSKFSLYFNTNCDVLKIQSNNAFEHQQKYIKLDSIPPKAKYSIMVWTEYPISEGQIIAESDYKIRINYSNDSSPFWIQIFWNALPLAILIFLSTAIQIWLGYKDIQKLRQECDKISKEIEKKDQEFKAQKAEVCSIQEKHDESIKDYEQRLLQLNREFKDMRLYYLTNITQLRKELSFWRDTIRKILYNNKTGLQSTDKVIEAVTSTLKTYATRKNYDKNMDELVYLSQLIADSRELRDKYSSPDSKNNT